MITPEELLIKEFKKMLEQRQAQLGTNAMFYINNLPSLPSNNLTTNTLRVTLKGIQEPYFEHLNESMATVYTQPLKTRIAVKGSIVKSSDGTALTKEISLPADSIAIVSKINIKLRNYVMENGIKKIYKRTFGFDYVDFIDRNNQRYYIYIIPKKYVYKVNSLCLLASNTARRNYYKGYKLCMQNGNFLYLYIMPYKKGYINEINTTYKVLGTSICVTNLLKNLTELLKIWLSKSLIFNWDFAFLETDASKGKSNMVYQELISTLDIAKYQEVETVNLLNENNLQNTDATK